MSLTALQRKEIHEVLAQFGLKPKEREAYLALLAFGKATVTPFARSLRVPVTTAQSLLNRLTERGLLATTKRRSRTVYEAHEPAVLRWLLERKIEEVATIIPFLKQLQTESGSTPRIRVFEHDRINDILIESIGCKEKMVHEIVSAGPFQEMIGERLHYTRRRVKAGVRLRSLRVEATEIKKYSAASHARELREAKFLPREFTFRWSIFWWDSTVAFFSTPEEGIAWTIESASLRKTMQQLFDLLWSVSRHMETA
jgi:sugar-specific transcriptional regulator TrmB